MKLETNYKLVIFDWDGTLAKNLNVWLTAYKNQLAKEGIELSDQDIVMKLFGTGLEGANSVGVQNTQFFYDSVNEFAHSHYQLEEGLYPNVREILEWLRNNDIVLAIASNSQRDFINIALRLFGIAEYFSSIETADDVSLLKPNPEILLKSMQNAGITPDRTLMVGDSQHDVAAARAAGVKVCLYYPDFNKKFYSQEFIDNLHADYLIRDLLDLMSIIKRKIV